MCVLQVSESSQDLTAMSKVVAGQNMHVWSMLAENVSCKPAQHSYVVQYVRCEKSEPRCIFPAWTEGVTKSVAA